MANHKSAIKRHRQSLKRRARNRNTKSAVRSAIGRVREAVSAGQLTEARTLLREAERSLSSSASKKIFHKRNASRRISRLNKLVGSAAGAKKA